MKKLNLLCGALVLVSTSVLTSCFSNDIPSIVISGSQGGGATGTDGVQIGTIEQASNYNYSIVCNVAADIRVGKSFDDVQKVSSASTYSGKGGIGEKIYIVASTSTSGYTKDEIRKVVTLDSNGKVIRLTFAKDATEATASSAFPYAISLDDANAKTAGGGVIYIENTIPNKREPYPNTTTDVKMEISNPMVINAFANGSKGSDLFTITAKQAVMTGINENVESVTEWFPVLNIMCHPDGAKFGDSPAKAIVTNQYLEKGMNFRCKGAVNDQAVLAPNGGSVTMQFAHFSDYIVESEAQVERTGVVEEVKTQTLLDCKVGNHTYKYFVYSGCDYDYHSNEFINKYLEAKFGQKAYAGTGEITISNLSSRATIPYTVTQTKVQYKVTFGSLPMYVWVYGPEEVEVDTDNAVIYDATKHSGGSAF